MVIPKPLQLTLVILGVVNGYDDKSTECIIQAFNMNTKLSTKYDSQEICGVLGLKNASDLIYDVSPKDIGIIQPPYMPIICFSKLSLTNELICWGSIGVDPDNFKMAIPTFFVHKSQMESYCTASNQEIDIVNPMYFPYTNQPEDPGIQQEQLWTDNVSQPLPDFLSNISDRQICSDVPEEMIIDLSTPESNQKISEADDCNDKTYLDYLSSAQHDDLLRKFILQEKTLIPESRCSECFNKSCKSCQIMLIISRT